MPPRRRRSARGLTSSQHTPSPAATPVVITHKWTENGAAKTKTVTFEKDAGTYQITAGADPTDVSIEMSVPSGRK